VPRGIYLWGEPGCGKTVLMDLAYRCGAGAAGLKKRTHFNSFMIDVHKRIFALKQKVVRTNHFRFTFVTLL
jgi:predicted ATPase